MNYAPNGSHFIRYLGRGVIIVFFSEIFLLVKFFEYFLKQCGTESLFCFKC